MKALGPRLRTYPGEATLRCYIAAATLAAALLVALPLALL